jgi:hypothetical protein
MGPRNGLNGRPISFRIKRGEIEPKSKNRHRYGIEKNIEKNRDAVEEPDDLNERRSAAEELDKRRRYPPHDPDPAHQQQGDDKTKRKTDRIGKHRQLERHHQAVQELVEILHHEEEIGAVIHGDRSALATRQRLC